jgi:hypothetical protein
VAEKSAEHQLQTEIEVLVQTGDRVGTIAAMRSGRRCRHGLGVTLAVFCVGVGLSACAAASVVTTSSTNVLAQTEQRLERAISGDARRNVHRYWKGRFRFAVTTRCRPTTPDGGNWACGTMVSSPRPRTTTCRIKTAVHDTKSTFRFDAPLPFARNVLSEGCPTLNSELSDS